MCGNNHDGHESCCGCSRRMFLASAGAAVLTPAMMMHSASGQTGGAGTTERPVAQAGPASKHVTRLRAAFVRRQGEYGMRWPGAIYDGEAALAKYRQQMIETAKTLGIEVDLRPKPIYSLDAGRQWVAEAEAAKVDGLFLVVLDRQEHAWPTATCAVDSPLPAVIFAPIGAAFTTNTAALANKPGALICSTDDFSQALFGMKMIQAGAKLRKTRFLILKGDQRKDEEMLHFGTKLRYLPAAIFLERYNKLPASAEIQAIADEYLAAAERMAGPTRDDVVNGVRSYAVARQLLEEEEADGISMDCLGALGKSTVSLPCIAWSRMLDHGVPAACEADLGACLTHALVQYLFDRPGFQQDPVPDTANETLIGAHCTCPIRLNGFDQPPEPYHLSYHHGKRDAVPVPHWRPGQRATVADILPSEDPEAPPKMIISAGSVVGNVSVPPAGGCVVSVSLQLDDVSDLLAYPGFHQIFFYGDYKKELHGYCKLHGIEAQVV